RDFHVTGVQTCALPISQMGVQFLLVALSAAREQGIDELYLAAPGSFPLFEAIGFSAADASELPEPIRRSEHLKEAERSGEIRVKIGRASCRGRGWVGEG